MKLYIKEFYKPSQTTYRGVSVNSIFAVQPLPSPAGLIYYLNFRYSTNKENNHEHR